MHEADRILATMVDRCGGRASRLPDAGLCHIACLMEPSRARARPRFLTLLETLEADPDVSIIPASDELFRRGVDLYRRRPDKDWPLTDCFSFVVMGDVAANEALTGDHHFQQAGFVALLLEP